ncbi:calcium-binding protein [Cognatishimia sp. F0-27]|uniref:calcium-binding protein n=1 Tax=Cognatishimia sp. F0-27 TaxID=2816855 RepID=UPI001D0CAAE8|nr:calcium-binding protein [Cognatishimia sp. F0-27]MCC1495059.1 hypothetical protein [Cognatishimia sp. F0-27]
MAIGNAFLTPSSGLSLEALVVLGLTAPDDYRALTPGALYATDFTHGGQGYTLVLRGEGLASGGAAGLRGTVTQIELYAVSARSMADPTTAPLAGFLILSDPVPAQSLISSAGTVSPLSRPMPDGTAREEVSWLSHAAFFDLLLPADGVFGMVYTGAPGADIVNGYRSNDTLAGAAGHDVIVLSPGDDLLFGGSGRDTVDGGLSATALTLDADGRVRDSAGNSSLIVDVEAFAGSGFGDDLEVGGALTTLSGAGGNDRLVGDGRANALHGDGGNDTLIGGAGDDTLTGGAGTDLAIIGAPRATATVRMITGGVEIRSAEGTDRLIGIERIQFSDQIMAPDTLVSDGAGSGGGSGASEGGGNAPDGPLRDTGSAGPDRISGGAGNDTLAGGSGNDTLAGLAGNDDLAGGSGRDLLQGGAGRDTLRGADGFDSLSGGDGADLLHGNAGNDTVTGGAGADTLEGGVGFDSLSGDGDADFLRARDGFDTLLGGAGHDTLQGNNGNDRLDGGTGNDLLQGGFGADTLEGGSGSDRLEGGNGFDRLTGGAGADTLLGNAGNDRLDGGAGNDRLQGGLGADTFVFTAGADVVVDFQNAIDAVRISADLLRGADPGAADLRDFARLDAAGQVVLDFGSGNTLTFEGGISVTALRDDVSFF